MNQIEDFGLIGEKMAEKITLSQPAAQVTILTYGATLQSFIVNGVDIIVSSNDSELFYQSSSYMGQVVGPVANRIKDASFFLEGKKYTLTPNNNGNCLHSGVANFGEKFWKIEKVTGNQAVLSYDGVDGDGGFPGKQKILVTYTLKNTELLIEYEVVATKRCPINITNHAYFNLNGNASSILEHELTLNCDNYVEVDSYLIPTEIKPCANTDFDFSTATQIGKRRGGAYDHCLLFSGEKKGRLSNGKLALDFETSMPGIQIYTGQFLSIAKGKFGPVSAFGGVALESEYMPDSANHSEYPGVVLEENKTWKSFTSYKVSKV